MMPKLGKTIIGFGHCILIYIHLTKYIKILKMSLTTFEIVQFSNSQSHHLSFAGLGQVVMYRRVLKKTLRELERATKLLVNISIV